MEVREDRTAGLKVFLLRVAELRPAMPWLEAVLDDSERVRAKSGFAQEAAREEFLVGRAVLRLLLARRLCVPVEAIALGVEGSGKPRLVQPFGAVAVLNVSHSHGLVALALGEAGAVGIDVERLDGEADVVPLAEVAWGAEAGAALLAIASPTERILAFFRRWVRFEAEAKFDGRGIAAMAKAADNAVEAATQVYEFDVQIDRSSYVGCVAVERSTAVEAPAWLRLDDVLALRDR